MSSTTDIQVQPIRRFNEPIRRFDRAINRSTDQPICL